MPQTCGIRLNCFLKARKAENASCLAFDNGIKNLPHSFNHRDDEGIAHAKETHTLRHSGIGPIVIKSL